MNGPHPSAPIVISVENVGKSFRLSGRSNEIKTALLRRLRSPGRVAEEPFWALRDVSLQVSRGESLGVIGANGSGKSTLLRLMAGITRPTRGRVSMNGRVSALLELGAGFHEQISGRDNAVLNAVLLGLSLDEARRRLDDIVAFAELEQFIDEPMRTYSYGMQLRLGFSVAVHVQPEILLVDEVLAVGDAEFQAKCYRHIEGLRTAGVTIVIVSHDLPAVERFSDRVVLLEHGRIAAEGEPREVVGRYLALSGQGPGFEALKA